MIYLLTPLQTSPVFTVRECFTAAEPGRRFTVCARHHQALLLTTRPRSAGHHHGRQMRARPPATQPMPASLTTRCRQAGQQMRGELSPAKTASDQPPSPRTYTTKHGTTATMNTANRCAAMLTSQSCLKG